MNTTKWDMTSEYQSNGCHLKAFMINIMIKSLMWYVLYVCAMARFVYPSIIINKYILRNNFNYSFQYVSGRAIHNSSSQSGHSRSLKWVDTKMHH